MISLILTAIIAFALGRLSRVSPANCKKYTNLLIYIGSLIIKYPVLKDDLIKLREAICYNKDILKVRK